MFGDGSVRVQGAAANVGSENGESGSDIKPFLIALVVINAILVIGILAAVAFWLSRSRRNDNPRMRDPAAPQFAPLREEKDTEYYDPYQPRTPTPMNADRQ